MHTLARSVNTIIPNILNYIWKAGRTVCKLVQKTSQCSIIFFITFLVSMPAQACYHNPRQLSALSERILKHHGNQRERQQKLVQAFKDSIPLLNKPLKPDDSTKNCRSRFNKKSISRDKEKNEKIINHAIEEFHAIPGFLIVISRILDGAISRNTANFSGALGELQAAVEKKKQQKTIIAFNERIIDDADGRKLTEIDLVMQDENGTITWQEIKTRNKLRKDDPKILTVKRKNREILQGKRRLSTISKYILMDKSYPPLITASGTTLATLRASPARAITFTTTSTSL